MPYKKAEFVPIILMLLEDLKVFKWKRHIIPLFFMNSVQNFKMQIV